MRFRVKEAIRSENVDMSNEKNDEKEFGRKPKGSDIKSNSSRVIRTLMKSWEASSDGRSQYITKVYVEVEMK